MSLVKTLYSLRRFYHVEILFVMTKKPPIFFGVGNAQLINLFDKLLRAHIAHTFFSHVPFTPTSGHWTRETLHVLGDKDTENYACHNAAVPVFRPQLRWKEDLITLADDLESEGEGGKNGEK
ncbi:hypothetical protein RJ640_012747, partial [Escallonia rubra]